MTPENRELLFVLLSMVVILIICALAVFLFVRQWRKEMKDKEKLKKQ